MFVIHPASDTGKETAEEKKEAFQREELKAERGRMGCGGMVGETKQTPPGKDEVPGSGCPSSIVQAQREPSAPRFVSPAVALDKALSILERPPALTQPPVTPTSQKKSPSTPPALPQPLEKLLVSLPPQQKTPSTIPAVFENPRVSPMSHEEKGSGTVPATVDLKNSTQAVSKQHTTKAEPADQRTEPPLPE